MTIYIRPSGSEIELQDTDNHEAFAKAQGWEKKKVKPGPKPKADKA